MATRVKARPKKQPPKKTKKKKSIAAKPDSLREVRAAFDAGDDKRGMKLLAGVTKQLRSARRRRSLQELCWQCARKRQNDDDGSCLPLYAAGIALYRDGDDTEVAADMLNEYGYYLQVNGKIEDGEAALRRAIDMHTAAGRENKLGWALGNLSSLMFTAGKMFEAEQLGLDSIVRAKAAGDAWALPNLMYGLAMVLHQQGKETEAAQVAREAEPLARAQGRIDTRANLTNMLANIALDNGDLDEASKQYAEARRLFKMVNLTHADAITVSNMGLVAWERGDLDEAVKLFGRALRTLEKVGDRRSVAISLTDRGSVRVEQGNFAAGQKDLERALAVTIEVGHVRRQAQVRSALANLAEERGDLEDARAHFAEAEIVFAEGERDDTRGTARKLLALAGLHAAVGDLAAAETVLARATALHPLDPTDGNAELRALADLARGRIAAAAGRHDEAAAAIAAAEPLASRSAEVRRVVRRLRAALAPERARDEVG